MKKGIHPAYYTDATISCACGNTIHVGATKKSMAVEICSACHPFFTGKEKLIDTAGRVERFRARVEKARTTKQKLAKKVSVLPLARARVSAKRRPRKTA